MFAGTGGNYPREPVPLSGMGNRMGRVNTYEVSDDPVAGLRNAMESAYPDTVCAFFQDAAANHTRSSKLEKKKKLAR